MTQQALDFARVRSVNVDGCDKECAASMLALNDAYTAAGNLVIAGATGIDKSDLPKMFEAGSNRHLRYSAVFTIGRFASMELRRRALEPLARCWGLEVCEPRPPMTDAERADRLDAALVALGPLGVQMRDMMLGLGGGK